MLNIQYLGTLLFIPFHDIQSQPFLSDIIIIRKKKKTIQCVSTYLLIQNYCRYHRNCASLKTRIKNKAQADTRSISQVCDVFHYSILLLFYNILPRE